MLSRWPRQRPPQRTLCPWNREIRGPQKENSPKTKQEEKGLESDQGLATKGSCSLTEALLSLQKGRMARIRMGCMESGKRKISEQDSQLKIINHTKKQGNFSLKYTLKKIALYCLQQKYLKHDDTESLKNKK